MPNNNVHPDDLAEVLRNEWEWLELPADPAEPLATMLVANPDTYVVQLLSVRHLHDIASTSARAHRYFDPDTRAFFGSRDGEVVTDGAYIERQTNAPDGYGPWVVVAWLYCADHHHDVFPVTVAHCATQAEARRLAVALPELVHDARVMYHECVAALTD
jgi:hypothetical protein